MYLTSKYIISLLLRLIAVHTDSLVSVTSNVACDVLHLAFRLYKDDGLGFTLGSNLLQQCVKSANRTLALEHDFKTPNSTNQA